MRFAFYLEEIWRPDFSLRGLREGRLGVGGQSARLRMLFWLARRGHEVILLNRYDEGEVDGVRALRVGSHDDVAGRLSKFGGVDLFVFNNSAEAPALAAQPVEGVRAKVLWAGNPIPTEWCPWVEDGRIDRIVFVSQSHRDAYRIYPGFRRFEMIYSGIDLDLIDNDPTCAPRADGLAVFLGAPRVVKGFHHLLQAWPAVRKVVPRARLRVLGAVALHDSRLRTGWTGVLDEDFERQYLEPVLDGTRNLAAHGIEFGGLLPQGDVFAALRQAQVAIVNCNWEGATETYCRSALEAQACGTPVVGAARGSLPEVVRHGVTGLLVGTPTTDALAATIATLLRDGSRCARLGEAGTAWARRTAGYHEIAEAWESLGRRAARGEDAPASRHVRLDLLRMLHYGSARIAAKRMRDRALGGPRPMTSTSEAVS